MNPGTYTFNDTRAEDFMTGTETAEVEEAEYRAYASLLGIEPGAPARPASEGRRMVRVSAAEVERLRAMAAYKDAAAETDDDAFYERHRSMILGVAS